MQAKAVFETMSNFQKSQYRRQLMSKGMSICGRCLQEKPLANFLSSNRTATGYSSRCRTCHLEVTSSSRRKLSTGWTEEEYNAALLRQEGKCAICKQPEPRVNRTLSADHCHSTQIKRGLLCSNCNMGLGHFKDDPKLLTDAILYLRGEL